MTDTTPRAGVPLLAANQAQKNVTHNEALYEFDALIGARFLDRDLSAPPSSPSDGDTYLVKATASGAWTGQDGNIAYCADGGWRFYPPIAGLIAYVADEATLIAYNGSAWVNCGSLLSLQNIAMLGVNTTADSTNKLAVQSNAVLLSDVSTGSGGTGDIRATLSKQAAGNTASLLFQDNFSGRAELGLSGDDDLHFKVSPDGATWADALRLFSANGHVAVGAAAPGTGSAAPVHISQAVNSPPSSLANSTDTLLLSSESNTAIHLINAQNAPNNRWSILAHRARGNFAALAAVQANDKLFGFIGGGYDGAANQNSALIEFICDGTPSSGHVPSRISFTTGTNSTDRLERLKIFATGQTTILSGLADQSYSYQSPSTGFSITVPDTCSQLILDPAGTLASGTVVMPANPVDGQICKIGSSQAVTALTHSPNTGQTLKGALSTIGANGFGEWKYIASVTTWFRTN